ncbi:zinc-binding dehydrogenase [Lentzea sp. NPDC004782]|uniref:zinc-binding dehydrogenase n=1 Tax=Lentzea sp. NPDC004782 TaxID=3154458 RepID=UPI0033B16D8C
MRAAIRTKANGIQIEDVPDPGLVDSGDAIVRVVLAAVCGTDLWGYRGLGEVPPGPRAGHEFLGVVEEVGPTVMTLQPGQLVLAPFMWSDGTCAQCQKRLPTSCEEGGMWGGGHDGGQGEAVRVPYADATLIALPMDEQDERLSAVLTLADVMSTGHHAIRNAEVIPGKTVAVIGDGAVGLCTVLAASLAGADRILLMSRHESRSRLGRKFGATDVLAERGAEASDRIRELTQGRGADAVVDCVGTTQAVETAVAAVGNGGTVVLVGAPHAALKSTDQIFLRNLRLTGGLTPARVLIPELLDSVLTGQLDPSPVFDLVVGLDAVPSAYQRMHERNSIKALIRI